MKTKEATVYLPDPHPRQIDFLDSPAKRKVVRAGRRSGKTVGMAIHAVEAFLQGRRVLYAAPTADQLNTFWRHVRGALNEPVDAGVYYKNESEHVIDRLGTEQRIKAKTAWNADTLRGDYCDLLILDEFQLMNEDAWSVVGAPMLLDNDGDAVFIYTPPSLHSRSVSKARDKRHAAKLFRRAQQDSSGRWQVFHFTSHDNPHISQAALGDITGDMSRLAYLQEIEAQDIEEVPGALWSLAKLDESRVDEAPDLSRIVVAIDPAATSGESSDETGIVVAGVDARRHGYLLADLTLRGTPAQWAEAAIRAFDTWQADRIVAETNNGGEMVEYTIKTTAKHLFDAGKRSTSTVPFRQVHASRGKATRAEPVSALYEQGRFHQVGVHALLEEQFVTWVPGDPSPDRLDAAVWAATELLLGATPRTGGSYQG